MLLCGGSCAEGEHDCQECGSWQPSCSLIRLPVKVLLMLLFTLQCYYRVRQMLQKRMMVRIKREHKGNSGEIQNTRSLKSVRLIMTPLIGIMLSNCDVSVRMSCLNTWCYLLPRLDTFLNDSSMINRVVDPMFEAAFQLDPNGSDFGKDKSLKFLQLWIYRRLIEQI
ncbi:uncharacterized protein LOC112174621 [Rosa chinensis]|uniref:uncharacterized protein LOC112174621 n=1 Tax=Rosa chinensis TaxID=74649 RepID=UPI000D08DC72|nr:uncharacterized protein LOC112174621 [Rosa chinensis]